MPSTIHTHDKIVESRILKGRLENVLYDFAEVAAGGKPVYEVAYLGDKYATATKNVLQKTARRVQAKFSRAQILQGGDCYRIESHAYHEAIVPADTATATIVCMHSPSAGPVEVLGLDGYPERIGFQRTERRAAECMDFA